MNNALQGLLFAEPTHPAPKRKYTRFREPVLDPSRAKRIAALLSRERWTPQEAAYYLVVDEDKIYKMLQAGEIVGYNIAPEEHAKPRYRIYRDTVLKFERERRTDFDLTAVSNPNNKPKGTP